MPCIVSTVHDPVALAAICRRLGLAPPLWSSHLQDSEAVSGWVLRLPGLAMPIVCNTLTGLIAYHPLDNEFHRYACIMRFLGRYYDLRAQLRRGHIPAGQKPRRPRPAKVSV